MNIPKEAIEKAIAGGWKPKWDVFDFGKYHIFYRYADEEFEITHEEIALDPSFWIALGKALGWEKKMVVRRGMVIGNFGWENPDKNIRFYGEEMGAGMDYMNPWIYYAHRFYNLVLTGCDTKAFWADLLSTHPQSV